MFAKVTLSYFAWRNLVLQCFSCLLCSTPSLSTRTFYCIHKLAWFFSPFSLYSLWCSTNHIYREHLCTYHRYPWMYIHEEGHLLSSYFGHLHIYLYSLYSLVGDPARPPVLILQLHKLFKSISKSYLKRFSSVHNQKFVLPCELSPIVCCRLRRTGVDSL